jgi:hypothetical protein
MNTLTTPEIQKKYVALPGIPSGSGTIDPMQSKKFRVIQYWLVIEPGKEVKLVQKNELGYLGEILSRHYFLVEKNNGLVTKEEIELNVFLTKIDSSTIVKTISKTRTEFYLDGHKAFLDRFDLETKDPAGSPVKIILEIHFLIQSEADAFKLPDPWNMSFAENVTGLKNSDLHQLSL